MVQQSCQLGHDQGMARGRVRDGEGRHGEPQAGVPEAGAEPATFRYQSGPGTFRGDGAPSADRRGSFASVFGLLEGTVTIAPGTNLTDPVGEDWDAARQRR